MRPYFSRYFLLTVGISCMVFIAAFDLLRPGHLHFGTNQLAAFVISTIIALAGIHDNTLPRARTWFGILLLVYFLGLLYMGLKPAAAYLRPDRTFLHISTPPEGDFIINILGFVPFGYLALSYLILARPSAGDWTPALMAAALGIGTSLFIEIAQYYIPGRTSSFLDVFANSAGTLIGIGYGAVEILLKKNRS